MFALSSLFWICLFISPPGIPGQKCTYQCSKCKKNGHYDVNAAGECERNDAPIRFLLLGDALCSMGGDAILDETTCLYTAEHMFQYNNTDRLAFLPEVATVFPAWDNSTGCRVEAIPSDWMTWGDHAHTVKTVMCIQRSNFWAITKTLLGGFLAGFLLTFLGRLGKGNKACNVFKKTQSDEKHRRKELRPGAKQMAADQMVKGGGARRACLIYRCLQITANACVPAVILIFINPLIVLGLYFVLYFIPAFRNSGWALLQSHMYLVTPPDVSLFGIDQVQPDLRRTYLYEAIRPYIMGTFSAGMAYYRMYQDADGKSWAWNPTGFFRAALLREWGPIILDATAVGVAFGTIVYTWVTFALVFSSYFHAKREGRSLTGERIGPISLVQNPTKTEKGTHLAEDIVTRALEIDAKGENHDIRMKEEFISVLKFQVSPSEERKRKEWDQFFNSRIAHYGEGDTQSKGIDPFSWRDLFWECFMGFVTLGSYAYKLFVFLRVGRFFLAFVLCTILAQGISQVVMDGTIYRALKSVPRAARLGVQTDDFLALAHWNEKGAGVIYLMITIYGLPLSGTRHWYSVLLAMALNTKAVYSLAKVMVVIIDMDTFSVYKTPPSEDDDHNDDNEEARFFRHADPMVSSSEEEEEEE